jgi:ArsR family transcriptional regulator
MTKQRIDGARSLEALVDAAKALAHPTRLRLVAMLATGELCVCQMTSVLELAPSTVSQHLSVLARGGLVLERKEGRLVFYRLTEDPAFRDLTAPFLDGLEADRLARNDRALVARVRRVAVAVLCAAELDLEAIGIRRPRAAAERQGHRA